MSNSSVKIKIYDCCEDEYRAGSPQVKTLYSACADVKARFHKETVIVYSSDNKKHDRDILRHAYTQDCFVLNPNERACIPTGLILLIPHTKQIKLLPRSGLALKHGITLINSPGTIDSDYTMELMVILHNTSEKQYAISEGDSIAQMEVTQNNMPYIEYEHINDLSIVEAHKRGSNRGGGLGSTGY